MVGRAERSYSYGRPGALVKGRPGCLGEGPTRCLGEGPTGCLGEGPTGCLGEGPTRCLGEAPTRCPGEGPTWVLDASRGRVGRTERSQAYGRPGASSLAGRPGAIEASRASFIEAGRAGASRPGSDGALAEQLPRAECLHGLSSSISRVIYGRAAPWPSDSLSRPASWPGSSMADQLQAEFPGRPDTPGRAEGVPLRPTELVFEGAGVRDLPTGCLKLADWVRQPVCHIVAPQHDQIANSGVP
ncbi:hypothetical protein BVRB_007990 [Beta vulgaris subsp. vulgaris]|uniref:Uncharacterized protein n=1 Tax=Beta vulgaris subsp. vulgaris TaxID=3555 RepID=A0A0J8DX67_BETVV|nr:hypothetical protein BVRB_007990 [Beta vulgaris subsp. vulgaris]